MKGIILFILSILLTAVFSYSLQVFLKEDYVTLTLNTMLIPCFTWTALIIISYLKLERERLIEYITIAGLVCATGSAILVPAGVYNFLAAKPDIDYSIISVLACVLAMSILFFVLLRRNNFSLNWWWAYNILICINMAIFYLVAR